MTEKEWKSITNKMRHDERKKNHQCVRCGKEDAHTSNGYSLCFECNEKHKNIRIATYYKDTSKIKERDKKRYEKLKAQGLCVRCGKEDAYTSNGYSLCFECNEKATKRINKYRENNKAKKNQADKEWREKKKTEGLCVRCGKRKAKENRTSCEVCLSKSRNYQRKKHITTDVPDNNVGKI